MIDLAPTQQIQIVLSDVFQPTWKKNAGSTEPRRVVLRSVQPQNTPKTSFSREQLQALYSRTVAFVNTQPKASRFTHFYRDKWAEDWKKIQDECSSIMHPYRKDNNGHPACPLNENRSGLFFNARPSEPENESIYGNRRFRIAASNLMAPKDTGLYFADFYCIKSVHYVTIVLTKRGSENDQWCAEHLLPLDAECNPLLWYKKRNGRLDYWVHVSRPVWVELFYMESVDLRNGRMETVSVKGRGRSTLNGLPNNDECVICNVV